MKLWGLLSGIAVFIALAQPSASGETDRGSTRESSRGATLPWITCEAESAKTNATIEGPDFTGNTAAREASGRGCVRLGSTGQFVEFAAKSDAQGLVVRYSIPDSQDGVGIDATLT